MLNLERQRLDAARHMISHLAEHLQADIGCELWSGEVLPLGAGARTDIRLMIRSSDTVRRLLLSPKLMTVFELYAAGDLDIVGGSPLEAAERWDHLKALHLTRNVDRKRMLKWAWPFLLGGTGKSTFKTETAYDAPVAAMPAAGRKEK